MRLDALNELLPAAFNGSEGEGLSPSWWHEVVVRKFAGRVLEPSQLQTDANGERVKFGLVC
jgi:hypothetical protein